MNRARPRHSAAVSDGTPDRREQRGWVHGRRRQEAAQCSDRRSPRTCWRLTGRGAAVAGSAGDCGRLAGADCGRGAARRSRRADRAAQGRPPHRRVGPRAEAFGRLRAGCRHPRLMPGSDPEWPPAGRSCLMAGRRAGRGAGLAVAAGVGGDPLGERPSGPDGRLRARDCGPQCQPLRTLAGTLGFVETLPATFRQSPARRRSAGRSQVLSRA